jgi:hypothetical protein
MKSPIRHSAASGSTHRKVAAIVASGWRPESGYGPSLWLRMQRQLRRNRRRSRQEAAGCEC